MGLGSYIERVHQENIAYGLYDQGRIRATGADKFIDAFVARPIYQTYSFLEGFAREFWKSETGVFSEFKDE